MSASVKVLNDDGSIKGYIVLDIDVCAMLAFLTGDSRRVYFEPYFKVMYTLIVLGCVPLIVLGCVPLLLFCFMRLQLHCF